MEALEPKGWPPFLNLTQLLSWYNWKKYPVQRGLKDPLKSLSWLYTIELFYIVLLIFHNSFWIHSPIYYLHTTTISESIFRKSSLSYSMLLSLRETYIAGIITQILAMNLYCVLIHHFQGGPCSWRLTDQNSFVLPIQGPGILLKTLPSHFTKLNFQFLCLWWEMSLLS